MILRLVPWISFERENVITDCENKMRFPEENSYKMAAKWDNRNDIKCDVIFYY